MKTHGDGGANVSGMSWSTKAGNVFVSGHGDGPETRVQVVVDNRGALIVPLTLGAAGLVAAPYAAIAADGGGNAYLVLAAGVGITAALVWYTLRRITGKTRATIENLIEAIGEALDRERAS
jgi:hypothetical protein